MRQVKSKNSESVAQKAEQMMVARASRVANDINSKTNDGTHRAVEADRTLQKQVALQNSVLGRAGRTLEKEVVQARYAPANAPVPKISSDVSGTLVGKRRQQKLVSPNYQSALAPNEKNALERGNPMNKNDPQPRFQPRANFERPVPNERQKVEASRGAQELRAHGINGNPTVEARKRRELESRLRALAANSDY